MYIIPRTYECPECGTKAEYTPSGGVASIPIIDDAPVCPTCWETFVKSNVPVMRPFEDNKIE